MKTPLAAAITLAFFAASSAVHAWGADGHRLIAELAESQLAPAARAEVTRLLAAESGATMVSVSTWADEIRARESAPWHYINLPEGDCSYDPARDCNDGNCIVEAVNAQVAILKSKTPDGERLTALKWVIHLVGDVHQPLHAGLKSDKGGNSFQVQAFNRGTNLHSLWDSGLIRNRADGLDALRRASATSGVSTARPPQSSTWAIESCKVAQSPGFYPEGRFIDAAYVARWDPVLVGQIKVAAQRLAATLNDALR